MWPEGTEYRAFPSSHSSTGEYCFQKIFLVVQQGEKENFFNIKLWQNMKNRRYRDTFNLHKDFRRKEKQKKKQNFQVSESIYLQKAWGEGGNLQSSMLAEVSVQGETPQLQAPLSPSRNHKTFKHQRPRVIRDWERLTMSDVVRCNFFREQQKKRGPSLLGKVPLSQLLRCSSIS